VSGSKYYLVILDDFTHYLWTFPLKLISDTFTTLSNLFAYVSNQFGRKIKAIQCDNGREFDNSSTRIFLLSNGTQLQMLCPYTSPQNGKAERIIRSINNVIHTFLIQASLHGRYWAEGLHTATYLLNHLPTKAIQVACPQLPFSGPRPHMSISEFSVARVTQTLLQLRLISSLLTLSGVSYLATPLIIKATAALISPQTA
jgi:hypothetical protein